MVIPSSSKNNFFYSLLSYPGQCQGYAGTPHASWPVSGVCRYPARILASVRGMQVPRRYPGQCQGLADTPHLPWPVSGACQNWRIESLIQCFPGCVIRRLSVCNRVPHRRSRMETSPPFSIEFETDECRKDNVFSILGIEPKTWGLIPGTLSAQLSL